jgi:hypothetical protein
MHIYKPTWLIYLWENSYITFEFSAACMPFILSHFDIDKYTTKVSLESPEFESGVLHAVGQCSGAAVAKA